MKKLLCAVFGHWWWWWTPHLRIKPREMLPGFVYSCRRCPEQFNLLYGFGDFNVNYKKSP